MKKVALSLAGVLAAAAFAPEASAIPSFARQTGMACNACHQTHFPVLNGFGRAFKAAGYTMMGAQEKVEGEHLSIPGVLNGAILLKYRYQKTSGPNGTTGAGETVPTKKQDGQWQMGDELSLFFGGRIAETEHFTIGFLNENNMAASPMIAGLRIPVTFDLGAAKLQVVPFTTDGLGVAYGFELSSGGVMRANRWNEQRRIISAVQYNADQGADGGAAAGTAFVVQNDMGFINLTRWSSSFAPGANGGDLKSTNYSQNYLRVAATPSVAGFDIVAGFGVESGTSYSNKIAITPPSVTSGKTEAKQTFVDFQAHGEVAGMMSGFYAQYANAPVCTDATVVNCVHNGGTLDRKAFTVGAEMTVVPHTLIASVAYRNGKTGAANADGSAETDNAINLGVIYELTQNVELHANYAKYGGDKASPAGAVTSEFLGMLEAAW